MTTEDQLLSVIAAAQEKLAAIRRLPGEEPSSNDTALTFKFHVSPNPTRRPDGFTFLALRVPGANDYASWYITARNGTISRNPMTWTELLEFMTSRGVDSFEQLYTRTEWTDMHLEDTADQDDNNAILPSYS